MLSNTSMAAGNHTITLTKTYGACTQSVTRNCGEFGAGDAAFRCRPAVCLRRADDGEFPDHTPGAVSWAWAFDYNPYSYDNYQNLTYGGPAISNSYAEIRTTRCN